jgi:transposase
MSRPRRHFSAEFKAKVALEAIREQQTLNELASAYGIHPNLIRDWKKQATSELSHVFSRPSSATEQAHQGERERLFQQIGQLQYELTWVKKKAGLVGE